MTLIDFVKAREGCQHDNGDGTVTAYWDAAGGVWTIGWGTTGPEVTQGTTWPVARCEAALAAKLASARAQVCVLSPPTTQWPAGALDALTDFVYNEGSGNYQGSTVRKCVRAADWDGVRTHLLDWEFAGGKRLGGLITRREGEAAMIGGPPTV